MTWTSFCVYYAVAALALLFLATKRTSAKRRLALRTIGIATLMLCIFDGVAESRFIWTFPRTLGVYLLDVPLENVSVIFASAMHSLFFFLLFDDRPLSSIHRSNV